jgi:hypothetical protein
MTKIEEFCIDGVLITKAYIDEVLWKEKFETKSRVVSIEYIDGVMSAVEVVHKDDEEVIRLSLNADKYLEGVEIN